MRSTGRILLAHRQWLALSLVVILGALCLPGTASAAETTMVSIFMPSQSVEPGQQFTVMIAVVPNTTVAGMQFDLIFDPSLLAVDGIEEGDFLGQGGASTFFNSGRIDNQAGTVKGVFGAITSPGEAVSAPGTFARVTLTARTQCEGWPLSLTSVIVGDVDGNPVPVTLDNEGYLPDLRGTPMFQWWVLGVMIGVASMLISATVASILFRRHQMVKALESNRSIHG